MTIKDEICPTVKVDARLMGDSTLWIKTDKLDKVGRVLVEHGTRCKQFYQDAPEQRTGKWIPKDGRYYCGQCGGIAPKGIRWDFCPNCGADMRGEQDG